MVKEKKGKNLFEVNGIKYIDNIPKDMRISLTKEQYAEYLQQKELIERLQKENEELRVQGSIVYLDYKILKDKIKEKIEELHKEQENEYDGMIQDFIDTLKELLEEE